MLGILEACAFLLASLLLAACASGPVAPPPTHLFHDEVFGPPPQRIAAADIFAVSEPMKRFLREELAGKLHGAGVQQRFAEALYTKGELRIDYESVRTRTAAETFDARAGNCLSLVIMTAALAKVEERRAANPLDRDKQPEPYWTAVFELAALAGEQSRKRGGRWVDTRDLPVPFALKFSDGKMAHPTVVAQKIVEGGVADDMLTTDKSGPVAKAEPSSPEPEPEN